MLISKIVKMYKISGPFRRFCADISWVNAFDIVESDCLEAVTGKDDKPSKTKANVNAAKIVKLIESKYVNEMAVKQHVKSAYGVDSYEQLSDKQAKELMEMLSQKPDKNA